jgi:transposase-like protein
MLTLEGKKEIIGICIGENETSKYWLSVLNDIARSAKMYLSLQ